MDILSQFRWVRPNKRKTADACRNALKEIISDIKDESPFMHPLFCTCSAWEPEQIWVDKGREFAKNLHHSALTQPFICTQQTVKQNQYLQSEIFAS